MLTPVIIILGLWIIFAIIILVHHNQPSDNIPRKFSYINYTEYDHSGIGKYARINEPTEIERNRYLQNYLSNRNISYNTNFWIQRYYSPINTQYHKYSTL